MRSDLEYFFTGDANAAELRVKGQIDVVTLTYHQPDHWDPSAQKEVHGDRGGVSLSPSDARELAEMLLKAADHMEELNRSRPIQDSHMMKKEYRR